MPWLWPTEGKMIKGYSDSSKGIDISGRNGQPVLAAGMAKWCTAAPACVAMAS